MEVPASLSIGTQVSAKYKGAFCEAKVKSVVKQVKCRVTFGLGLGSATLSDELMKYEGNLGVGSVVEARHPEKQEYLQATVNKIQDQSQYTVVFDDGDITSLRRNALCMKSGKHYNASESLDNLPLTHPEHFSTPVSGSRRRKRGHKESENEESSSSDNEEGVSSCYLTNIGRVVWTENTENKKSKVKETWFPALIVAPSASDTVKINTKEEFLIRSFKDGRYYTVRKKDTNQFKKDSPKKSDNPLIKEAMEKAISYIETKELPPHWDKEHLFNMGGAEESTTESSESEEIEDDEDEESREEKDHLVAELYKHMEDRGAPINRTPNIVGKDLDLYKLFRIVYKYGGHQRVTNNNKWRQIAHKLGFETTWCVNQVRVNYKRYLQSFEELYKTLGCTMKSGSTSKQRQGSGNGSSGRVQIRGRSREMLKQQLSSSKDSSNSSHNEDTASDSSKETPSISSTKFIVNTANENTVVEKVVVSAPKKPSSEESSKEDSEEVEEVKLPVSTSKKSIKDKKTSTSASKSDSLIKKSKDEAKFVGTRNRRDSNSSSVSGTIQIKTQKDDITPGPSAKKSLTKELSEIDIGKKPTKSSSTSKLIESSGDEPLKILKGRKKHKESKKTVSSISTTPVITSVNSSSANNLSTTVNLSTPIISSEDTSDIKSRSSDSVGEEEPQYLSPDVDVRVGDKIKVFYIRGIIYDAKVIKCQEQEKNNSKWPRYYVHYQGWNARYDEWINRSRIAENLSWTKDRPRKDGKEDSSDVKRDSTSRASTPAKSYGDQSPASSNKRGVRSVKKMESDISDAEEEDSEKSSSKKEAEGENEKKKVKMKKLKWRKILNEETVDITSSPTKAKRGRKSTKESQVPTASSIISTIGSVSKKEEAEEPQSSIVNDESPSKRSLNRITPIREQRPSEDESVDKESKFTKNIDEEDPYAFKEPEPFEEVKFETPPRKVSTPPTTNTTTTAAFIPQKKI
ncbi:RAB1A [Lepeophtheirus salmonis]|uniref:RAB1A n=1 Tax=Lepeophtheirus salmonis TaxID=72036 RepID=A0A7R8H8L1_LEPSM|nr:RAB1A [Lepeophtheirus salmonis]CAF2943830.1 RAB1A [Lepeophtheirus salmonis]